MTKAPSQLEIGEREGQARKVPTASSLQPGWGLRDPGMLSEVPGTPITAKFIHSSCSWKGDENVAWYDDVDFDLITIRKPMPGPWQVIGPNLALTLGSPFNSCQQAKS